MIHYNETWTRTVEGRRNVVVHGPLNLINMLDYWRDYHSNENAGPKNIIYMATSLVCAGESYVIRTTSVGLDGQQPTQLSIDIDGVVCVTGAMTALGRPL